MAWPLLLAVEGLLAGPGDLVPEIVTPAVEAAWEEHHREAGLSGDAADVPCTPFADELVLCLRVLEGPASRPVTTADLADWRNPFPEARNQAVQHIIQGLGPGRPEQVRVEGDARSYFLSAQGDGYDQAGLFDPDALARRAGGPIAVGIPARGVFIAFLLDDPELARIVAVGVRRAFETLPEPITDVLYTWNGQVWIPWGRSRPADEGAIVPPSPAQNPAVAPTGSPP